jgi:hypothetical protein
MKRIKHQEAYSLGACTNWAESISAGFVAPRAATMTTSPGRIFSDMRRKPHEDDRRMSNADQVSRVAGLVMHTKTSPDFVGYWQRHSSAS